MRAFQTCCKEGQLRKSSLVQNASSLCQNDTGVKSFGPMVNDILENQQQHKLISQEER